ncbi:MAG: hypothetical protein IJU44_08710 [Kiritimatiellae bacterium]|nr:hypothetical protein [Kiritimatiellia bacterium]
MRAVWAIARTTFIEAIQQPVAFLMYLFSVALTLLVPVFQFHRFSEDGRLARDSGLSCMLVFGMALAVCTAGRSVSKEIADGTAASVLGKPVPRPVFVCSKWLGCALVTAMFCLGQLAALMIAERASAHYVLREDFNGYATDPISLILALGGLGLALLAGAARHFFGRHRFGASVFFGVLYSQVAVLLFSGFYNRLGQFYPVHGEAACCEHHAAGEAAHALFYHPELNLRVIPAALLVFFGLLVFAALGTALSTRMRTGTVLAVCAGVLFTGLAGDTLFNGSSLLSFRGAVSGVLPDLQNFWLCDAIAHGGRISPGYVWLAGGYALTVCTVFLLAGCMAFQNRDVG